MVLTVVQIIVNSEQQIVPCILHDTTTVVTVDNSCVTAGGFELRGR